MGSLAALGSWNPQKAPVFSQKQGVWESVRLQVEPCRLMCMQKRNFSLSWSKSTRMALLSGSSCLTTPIENFDLVPVISCIWSGVDLREGCRCWTGAVSR